MRRVGLALLALLASGPAMAEDAFAYCMMPRPDVEDTIMCELNVSAEREQRQYEREQRHERERQQLERAQLLDQDDE